MSPPKAATPKPGVPKPGAPRLGRGLAALFADMPERDEGEGTPDDPRSLPTGVLDPNPFQPRMAFDDEALGDLADSIRTHGLLQPILVRAHPTDPGRYQIVAGERRWRAAQMAGLTDIPVVRRDLTDSESAAAALIENLQRENLNPIEEAEGYQRLVRNFGLTQEALGAAVSKSRAYVGNILRLLALPDDVLDAVRKGTLSYGHARAMLTLPDPAAAAAEVLRKGLSVRQTERLAMRLQNPPASGKHVPPSIDIGRIEQDLAKRIGQRVRISVSPRGDGALTIVFEDLFQLDELVARLTAADGVGDGAKDGAKDGAGEGSAPPENVPKKTNGASRRGARS